MPGFISQITPEMTATVDRLKATNFENATPEEIEVYAEFKSLISAHQTEAANRREIMQRESAERLELDRKQAQSAMNALDSLAELAQAKLKAVKDGAQKSK